MKRLSVLLSIPILVFASSLSLGNTWYVKADGTGDAPTIQAAIDSSSVGDTVLVASGTFTGPGNRGLDFGGKDIVVTSEYGADSTIIDCENSDRGFNLHSGETNASVIERLTIRDGNHAKGGGIFCSSASPVIRSNKILSNFGLEGAGIYCDSSSSDIYGNTISDNGAYINTSAGGGVRVSNGTHEIYGNTIQGNKFGGDGGGICCYLSHVYIYDNILDGNLAHVEYGLPRGGGIYCEAGTYVISGNLIIDNVSTDGGGIFIVSSDSCIVKENDILGNRADRICAGKRASILSSAGDKTVLQLIYGSGGGIHCSGPATLRIESNRIAENLSYYGGGIYSTGTPVVQENLIVRNFVGWSVLCYVGGIGGGVYLESGSLIGNTIVANSAHGGSGGFAKGGGIFVEADGNPTITNCIVVDNLITSSGSGGGIYNDNGTTTPLISCCDVYNNDEGNYSGNLPDPTGTNGNISIDPIFCDAANDDFSLRTDSPCLSANHPDGEDCGLIGALDMGCFADAPDIFQIVDVKNDQGRQVSIGWYKSLSDTSGSPQPILTYEIYRRIDELPSPTVIVEASAFTEVESPRWEDALMYPPGDWHYLFAVPAHCEDEYYVVAATLEDSCAYNDSTYYSAFFIRATTSVPSAYFDSPVDSGYSVDNLAPAAPEGLSVAYNSGGGNQLAWDPPVDDDFDYFVVYRGTDSSFTPGPENLMHETVETQWFDDTDMCSQYHYKITAKDFNGNESAAGCPMNKTAAGEPMTPRTFALYQNVPNPFNPATSIRFDVPVRTHVKLKIYGVNGELVRVLRDETMTPGSKEAYWDGRDGRGRNVSSGVYFCRLESSAFSQARKMVLLR